MNISLLAKLYMMSACNEGCEYNMTIHVNTKLRHLPAKTLQMWNWFGAECKSVGCDMSGADSTAGPSTPRGSRCCLKSVLSTIGTSGFPVYDVAS